MPRKKQIVQTQKRRKVYREGEFSGAATQIKPKGFFKFFHNYRLFAIIGAGALVLGLAISALYTPSGRNDDGSIRGDDVIRTTPEAGETSETGAAPQVKQYISPPPQTIDANKAYTATFKTAKGDVTVELLPDAAPAAVNNFVFLARDGYYNGVTFHRVVGDLIAQSGDPTGTGVGGPGYDLEPERTTEPLVAGTLAVAPNGQGAGSLNNGSQFFFLLEDEPTYDGKFTVFGRVTDGMDVLQELTPRDPMANNEAAAGDRIESITIEEV
jgi:cyclophilin family peptidyl-prolyl cis-trans isomerase